MKRSGAIRAVKDTESKGLTGANGDPRSLEEALATIQNLEKQVSQTIAVTERKVFQLEWLTRFSSILNSTLNTQTVREKALEATCRLLECDTGSLFLADHEKEELYWETALGPSGAELKQSFRLPINDKSIAGHVALTGESLIINDVSHSPFHFKKADEKTKFLTRSMVCVPVVNKGKIIGVLQAINKKSKGRFLEEDKDLLEALSHQVAIAIENAQLYMQLKDTFVQTAQALAEAIEAKDRYTGGHTKRVLHYSLAIAEYLDLKPDELENLRLSAILHDIGKIGIDDSVLKKQAPLDSVEFDQMKRHPSIGFEILSHVKGLQKVLDGMRLHHERHDGKGYPLGLKGDQIPLNAAIISVADTYDAMVSTRPYRKGLDPQIAFDEITKYRGTQFNPEVVDAFVKAYKTGRIRRKAT